MRAPLALVAALGLAAALAAAPREKPAAPALKVGDPAPALAVGAWVKGEPVAALQKDTVYVVECWATWCGPCRTTIPHLTDLQKKLKDAVFIGVAVSDQPGKVKDFVKKMGDKMDYRVGIDDQDKTSKTWMDAAGQEGIPCAFIVDKAGKVAWIGHPASKDFEAAIEASLKAADPGKAK
jgi:thiol-disulfide isomerase/thioredoxin